MKKWKIIFWAMAAIFALQIINVPLNDNHSLNEAISLILTGITLMPVYGYAYKVVIGTRAIAIIIFGINFLALIPATYMAITYTIANFGLVQLFFTAVGTFIVFMFFYPIYAYAFASKELWDKNA